MDKEKPEWLKSVERVEAQKKCAPNANIDKKKENKISHQEKQDEKPEWLKSVERVEAQRAKPQEAAQEKPVEKNGINTKDVQNLAKAHFNQVTSDIRLSKNSQEVIKAQQEEINRLICSYSPSEKALFYDIYHDQIKDCQTSMTLKTAPNSARPKSMYNVIGLTLILFFGLAFFLSRCGSENNGDTSHSSQNAVVSSEKIYTPAQLRGMIEQGAFPSQGAVSTERVATSFSSCVARVNDVLDSATNQYPRKISVDTSVMYIAKLWTNDSALTFTCSAPDELLVITTAKYK